MKDSVMFDFSGRNIFVAGGSSGINLGIAKGFAQAGANVAIVSRSPERVASALGELRSVATPNAKINGYNADVRDADAIASVLAQAHAALGDFDVLISGAAGNFLAPALGLSPKGFKTVVDIDLNGTFHVLRAAHEFLRKPGASVINISAPQAYNPTMFQAHVCAAKAGVDMLTKVLAMEWGNHGIRVNSIVPGPIADTEGIRRLAPTPEAVAAMSASVPLGRMGTTHEIAAMAMFLSCDQAAYVTGAIIPVDGGSSLGGARDFSAAWSAGKSVTPQPSIRP
jgi:NAD(P)-dependent dehydrogenase (short-subunit alcohol dehydrogenase family)